LQTHKNQKELLLTISYAEKQKKYVFLKKDEKSLAFFLAL